MSDDVQLKDVLQWLDKLGAELKMPKHDDSFGQFLVRKGGIHKIKGEIQELHNRRNQK